MINYYAFYDESLKLSNPPFAAADDNAAIRATRNMLLSSSDDVFNKVVPITELVFVGTFDEVKGVFCSIDARRKVISLKDIPLPVRDSDDGGTKE